MRFQLGLSFALSLILSGCFFEHQVAGGGSDQPNEIVGLVHSANNNPAPLSQVYLYQEVDSGGVPGFIPIDSSLTDSVGAFHIQPKKIGIHGLYIFNTKQNAVATISGINVLQSGTQIPLAQLALAAKVKASTTPNVLMQLDALPLLISSNANGDFNSLIPGGEHELLALSNTHLPSKHIGDFTVWAGDSVNLGSVVPQSSSNQILIDNFSDTNTQTLIGRYFGGGWWFNSYSSGTATMTPSAINTAIVRDSTDPTTNYVIHQTATITNPQYPIRYALFGFSLGGGETGCPDSTIGSCYFDLNPVQSISFRAKGSGTIRIQIGVKSVYAIGDYRFPYYDITLSPNWSNYTIALADFKVDSTSPLVAQGINLSAQLTHVYNFTYLMTTNSDMWLDDIALNGIGLGELKITH